MCLLQRRRGGHGVDTGSSAAGVGRFWVRGWGLYRAEGVGLLRSARGARANHRVWRRGVDSSGHHTARGTQGWTGRYPPRSVACRSQRGTRARDAVRATRGDPEAGGIACGYIRGSAEARAAPGRGRWTQGHGYGTRVARGGGQGGESCEGDDIEWQAQIVYSGEGLGVGSFSVVHAARNISSGQQLAVKIVRIPADNAIFIKRLTREVKILREIDHPNIVKLTKVLESPTTCNLFMERCDGGELFTLLEGMEFSDDGLRSLVTSEAAPPQEFTEANIVHIIHQILSAVHHCHQRQIVHRDLKLENVLLVDPWVDGVYPCFAVISCLRSWCASKPQARSVRGMRVRVQTHTRVWTHCCDTWLLCLDMCLCTICAGISYIHTHSRAHTPHPGGRLVKVADFGFAKVLREGEHLISACGRSLYLLFIPSFVPMHTQASFYVEGGCRLAPCI